MSTTPQEQASPALVRLNRIADAYYSATHIAPAASIDDFAGEWLASYTMVLQDLKSAGMDNADIQRLDERDWDNVSEGGKQTAITFIQTMTTNQQAQA